MNSPRTFASMSSSFAAVFAFLLAGCAAASAVRFGSAVHAPRPVDQRIEVFDALGDVARPYEKIGRVVGEGDDGVSFARIVDCMCEEARRLGADAIVLQGGSLIGSGEAECAAVDRTVTAIALRWR